MPENQKKCFMENCSNKPIYFCDCGENSIFTCENHLRFHSELEGNHHYEQIYSEIHEEVRKAALKHFYKLKSDLKGYQSKIIQTELSLIHQILKITQNVLLEIKLQNKKLNECIAQICNINAIDNSKTLGFIESLLKLTPKDVPKITGIKAPKLTIRNVDYDFKELFNLDVFIDQNFYIEKICNGNHTMKFISIFDAKNQLINNIRLKVDKSFSESGMQCSLPDGSFFMMIINLILL